MPKDCMEIIDLEPGKWTTIWRGWKCRLRQNMESGDYVFIINDIHIIKFDEYNMKTFMAHSMAKSFRKTLKEHRRNIAADETGYVHVSISNVKKNK